MGKLTNLLKNEEGVTAIEYALLVALISLAIIVAVSSIAPPLNDLFNSIANTIGSGL